MGELLAAQDQMDVLPQREVLIDAVRHIIEEMDGGQSARFAKRVGVAKATIHYWLQTEKTPTLEASLMVASQSGISLAKLLTGDMDGWKAPSAGQQLALALFKPEPRRRIPRRDLDWGEIEHQLQRFLLLPTPISVREAARQLEVEPRQLYLNANQTARQLGERYMAYRKRRREANLNAAMPHLEAAGREVLLEGKALNLREMSARVPPKVLSRVQGLFDVLRDVQANIELSPHMR